MLGAQYKAPGNCYLQGRCLSVSASGHERCPPTGYFDTGQGNCLLGNNSFGMADLFAGWEPACWCQKDWADLGDC